MAECRGRPTRFDRKLADLILAEVANGKFLRAICRKPGMPPESTVREWIRSDREGFSAQWARSVEQRIDYWCDEIMDIADNFTGPISRAKLMIRNRFWILSRLHPERHSRNRQHLYEPSPITSLINKLCENA
jgi:hypothetical protein